MSRTITQRELRNDSGTIMRGLDDGETFIVTRNGLPVGQLTPIGPRRFVSTSAALHAFLDAPRIDANRLRDDLDAAVDQDFQPRA